MCLPAAASGFCVRPACSSPDLVVVTGSTCFAGPLAHLALPARRATRCSRTTTSASPCSYTPTFSSRSRPASALVRLSLSPRPPPATSPDSAPSRLSLVRAGNAWGRHRQVRTQPNSLPLGSGAATFGSSRALETVEPLVDEGIDCDMLADVRDNGTSLAGAASPRVRRRAVMEKGVRAVRPQLSLARRRS